MHKYVINDVWMALKLSFGNFFGVMFLVWGGIFTLPFIVGTLEPSNEELGFWGTVIVYSLIVGVCLSFLVLIQSIFIYFANRRYIVDLDSGAITFPRTDIENTILDIILLRPYWNLMRTQTVHATEVENIYLDTKRWSTKHKVSNGTKANGQAKFRSETRKHVRYNLNVAGTFGSANFEFLERQKRDEVRNAIQQCVKQHSNINVDRKVAELG